jgi:hypothetical protein
LFAMSDSSNALPHSNDDPVDDPVDDLGFGRVVLVGENSKQRRAHRTKIRGEARKAGNPPPQTYAGLQPPPPLCNRVASEWGEEPGECSCLLWPNYLHENRDRNVTSTESTTTSDGPALTPLVDADGVLHRFAYWRPGGKKKGGNIFITLCYRKLG